jgi:hypothetical protein
MNDETNDNLIDRYIQGRMKPSEEQEFRRLLELDPQLSALLAADGVLKETIRRDREAIPEEHPQIYTHFLGLLATSAPVGGALAGKGAATAATTTGKGTLLGSLVGSTMVKAVVATVGVVAVAIGTYVAVPRSSQNGDKGTPAQEQRVAPTSEHTTILPTTPAVEENVQTPTAVPNTTLRREHEVRENGGAIHERTTAPDDGPLNDVREMNPVGASETHASDPVVVPTNPSVETAERKTEVSPKTEAPAKVIRSNKVRTKVVIKTP